MDDFADLQQTFVVFEEEAGEKACCSTASDAPSWGLLPCQEGHPHYSVSLKEPLRLGRSKDLPPNCQWADIRVSGLHCVFSADSEGSLSLTDHSSNGVMVNGQRVGRGSTVALHHGDVVTVVRAQVKDEIQKPAINYLVQSCCSEEAARIPHAPPVLDTPGQSTNPSLASASTPPEAPSTCTLCTEGNTATQAAICQSSTSSSAAVASQNPLSSPAPEEVGDVDADVVDVDAEVEPLSSPASATHQGQRPAVSSTSQSSCPSSAASDHTMKKMEDNLTCGVCQQVFHQPVTCIPCMHNFCAGCFGRWRAQKHTCPQCRASVTEVRRNHAITNLAEDYLTLHPERKRSFAELAELDSYAAAAEEGHKKPKMDNGSSDGSLSVAETDSDDEDDDEEDGSSDTEDVEPTRPWPSHGRLPEPPTDRCAACSHPDRHGYQCPTEAPSHHQCSVCRRRFPAGRPNIPVQCERCRRLFCDRYWGCPVGDGRDSLRQLKEHRIDVFPGTAFNGNRVELDIVADHARRRGWSCQGVWLQCLARLQDWNIAPTQLGWPSALSLGASTCPTTAASPAPSAHNITASTSMPSSSQPVTASSTSLSHSTSQPPAAVDSVDPETQLSAFTTENPFAVQSMPPAPGQSSESGGLPLPATTAPTIPASLDDHSTPATLSTESPLPVPGTIAESFCCRRCAAEVYAELLPQYRHSIPNAELPASVTSRPDCWYGTACRTQRHNRSHCERFNHACRPSR